METESRGADWAAASFEGARREQLRRWSRLPLESVLRALEEMDEWARQFEPRPPVADDRDRK